MVGPTWRERKSERERAKEKDLIKCEPSIEANVVVMDTKVSTTTTAITIITTTTQMPLAFHPIYVGFTHKVVKQIVG